MNSSSKKAIRKIVLAFISPLPNQRIIRSMQKQLSDSYNLSKAKNDKTTNIEEIVTSKHISRVEDTRMEILSPLTIENPPNYNLSSLNNLKIGISQKKAEKFKFRRKQGQKLDNIDRQWILRLFFWFKSQSLFRDLTDCDLKKKIADIACCSDSTIRQIIESEEIELEDRRGHSMPKKIENEEEIKQNVINQLRACLDIGIPISSKDIRSWLQEKEGIDIRKTRTLQYLKNWGIEWTRLKQ